MSVPNKSSFASTKHITPTKVSLITTLSSGKVDKLIQKNGVIIQSSTKLSSNTTTNSTHFKKEGLDGDTRVKGILLWGEENTTSCRQWRIHLLSLSFTNSPWKIRNIHGEITAGTLRWPSGLREWRLKNICSSNRLLARSWARTKRWVYLLKSYLPQTKFMCKVCCTWTLSHLTYSSLPTECSSPLLLTSISRGNLRDSKLKISTTSSLYYKMDTGHFISTQRTLKPLLSASYYSRCSPLTSSLQIL